MAPSYIRLPPQNQSARSTRFRAQHLLIPLTALGTVFFLSTTPWGNTFQTLLGHSGEQHTAKISLTGLSQPTLAIELTSWEQGSALTLTLGHNGEPTSATLAIPADWHLQEVAGVHILDVTTRFVSSETITLSFPIAADPITLRLRTENPFDVLAFLHDSAAPALIELTHVTLPEKSVQKTVQIVEQQYFFPLL